MRLISVLAGLSLTGWTTPGSAQTTRPQPFFPPFGIDLLARDTTVRPGDDFFQYENGGWIARTAIPADLPSISFGREEAIRIEARVRQLIEAAAAGVPVQPTSTEGKVGAMYVAFMDSTRIEALGMRPIQGRLDTIAAATTREAIAREMGRSVSDLGSTFFYAYPDVDLKDPTRYTVYIGQAGLGMPDRDYYLKPEFSAQRAAYRAYVERLLTLTGWERAPALADSVVAMETRIARVSWPKAAQRDVNRTYNPMSPATLASYARGFPWAAFLGSAGLGGKRRLIVGEKSAMPRIAAIFAAAPVDVLKAWVAFTVADNAAAYLSRPFQEAAFAFREKALSGQQQMKSRWKRAVGVVSGGDCAGCSGGLRWAVGQVYVAHDFTAETRTKVQALVANLMAAFHDRIEKLDWMGPATKREAIRKLDTYTVKVGYPDHPRDYSQVIIRSDDLVGDVRRALRADWEFYVGRSEGPVDRTDWGMTPQTVDAYNGALRDIVFPAAVLQPPEYDPAADDAANYGDIGAIIGHELIHGFDDQGRKIDASGAIRDWWTPADAAAFQARAARLGAQYARFEPVPGMHINPELTMGENIADLGGLVIALEAYHRSLNGKPAPVIDGFTGDQRLFMAYAQSWRGKATDDFLRRQVASDPHSWRHFRVIGPVANIDAWYEAFQVRPGDRMYRAPKDRVRIW